MRRTHYSFSDFKQRMTPPNVWDFFALLLIFSIIFTLAYFAKQMAVPYHIGERLPITLDPRALPNYTLRTVLRMFLALPFSLLFTFVFGTLAAKNARAERIIIPIIDILQSVPVLGFLSISIVGFIALFPGSLLGPECAAIFAIFTGQAWNMTLSFYQSLRGIPMDLREASHMLQLSRWQHFWRVEVPFATPSLIWNTMVSMSGAWFYVVVTESITVSNQNIALPGIGSYIFLAIKQRNIDAVFYAILAMLVIILLYDQLIFRPLVCWSEKFKLIQDTPQEESGSWLVNLLKRTRLLRLFGRLLSVLVDMFINVGAKQTEQRSWADEDNDQTPSRLQHYLSLFWNICVITLLISGLVALIHFIYTTLNLDDILHVIVLGSLTGLRVLAAILIGSIIWIPIGVWIGMHSKVTRFAQPIIQIIAAFPANLFYPLMVLFILKFNLDIDIWVIPLILLNAQWYILFNIIAGASALPKDLYQATSNFGVKGWLWWRRFILPGIYPYYITGAITAAGAAWNATVVAEIISWGHVTLTAKGLGAYITKYTQIGSFSHTALGIGMMSLFVLLLNRVLWRPLFTYAQTRFQIN